MSNEKDEEDIRQLVSDNGNKEEEEYAPIDEGSSCEEEQGSRVDGNKKENEVKSEEEHEFDDAIGTIAFMFHVMYDCL